MYFFYNIDTRLTKAKLNNKLIIFRFINGYIFTQVVP